MRERVRTNDALMHCCTPDCVMIRGHRTRPVSALTLAPTADRRPSVVRSNG